MQSQGTGIDYGGDADGDINNHHIDGHNCSGGRVIAIFEVFRDCVDADFKELWQKEECYKDQSNSGDPFVAGDGHSHYSGTLAGHTDEMLGGDIRGDEGQADERPEQVAAGEEEIFACFFFSAFIHADADDNGEECYEYHDVKKVQLHDKFFPL